MAQSSFLAGITLNMYTYTSFDIEMIDLAIDFAVCWGGLIFLLVVQIVSLGGSWVCGNFENIQI